DFDRPMRFEAILDAGSEQPTGPSAGVVPTDTGNVQRGSAMHPAPAKLAVEKPTIVHEADAACHCPNPVLAHHAEGRCRKRGATETRPIEITFNTKQEVTRLNVVAKLDAANELGDAAIEIVARNVQAAAGPRPTEVHAEIESGPAVRRFWQRPRFHPHFPGGRRHTFACLRKREHGRK